MTPNLTKAIISVMNEVSSIEKSMTVGSGNSSYKGVSDKDVKNIVGKAMAKHGLCIIPIDVEAKSKIDRWDETSSYNGVPQTKSKQSVFVEVTTKYLLMHESGESQVIAGYGNGVDSQDKSAGKATTYALKNAILYTFMIPTGDIDDTDKTHSEDLPVVPKALPTILPATKQWDEAVKYLQGSGTIEKIKAKYSISRENEEKLKSDVLELVS